MNRMAMLSASVVLSAGVLAACGGGEEPPPEAITPIPSKTSMTTTPAQPAGAQIVISNFGYTVPPTVSAGQQLTIVNKDEAAHSVTSDAPNTFDVRVSGGGGMSTLTAPATPGTYPFYCKYHENMRGTLTVQ